MKLTVDASVVVKWFVPEALSDEARLLLGYRLGLHAPDLVLVEFANTIWKKVRRGELANHRPYIDELPNLSEVIALYPAYDLLAPTARIAQKLDHPVYDCLYLACAEATGSMLVTADRKFANKIVDSYPDVEVRYIGANDFAGEIGAAATVLVITPDKIKELCDAYDRLVKTEEYIKFSLHRDTKDLVIQDDKDFTFYFDSPAYKRIERMFDKLNRDERIDLLALGWFGDISRGHHHLQTDWQRCFDHACKIVDLQTDYRYEIGLAAHWQTGLDRLSCAQDRS